MAPLQTGGLVAVTGANGFIGSHVCLRLLTDGFHVRAIVRDAADKSKVAHLQAMPGARERLTCASGTLLLAEGFDEAFSGVDAVVHTAAAVEVINVSNPEERIVKPAVEGTRNVMAAASRAGVRRMVMTSSVAAVQSPWGLPDDHLFTEADWNTWSTAANDPYGFAKTQQERALWGYLEVKPGDQGGVPPSPFDAVVIAPGVTLGPALAKAHTKSSTVLVRELLYGNKMNVYTASFVDVRDVAAAISAGLTSTQAGGKRIIVLGDEGPMSTLKLGPLALKHLPQYVIGGKAPFTQSSWMIWLLARIGVVNAFLESQFTRRFQFSNKLCKELLGVQPRPLDQTVRDAAIAMIDNGWVKPTRRAGASPVSLPAAEVV